ncbi:MAG: hypothetical protein ABEI99_09550 [Halobaculum sp.]
MTDEESCSELALAQAQRVVDEQRQYLTDIDTKAVKLLRLNVLLIGVGVSVFSASSRAGSFHVAVLSNWYTVVGSLLLLLSTVASGAAYTRSRVTVGPNPHGIVRLASTEADPDLVRRGLAASYAEWIAENRRAVSRTQPRVIGSIVSLLSALLFVTTGLGAVVANSLPWYVSVAPICGSVLVAWRARLYTVTRRRHSTRRDLSSEPTNDDT